MSNLAATVGDARKRIEADDFDAAVRAWFAGDRDVPPERWDQLAPVVQELWREAYDEYRILYGVPGGRAPTGVINPY